MTRETPDFIEVKMDTGINSDQDDLDREQVLSQRHPYRTTPLL